MILNLIVSEFLVYKLLLNYVLAWLFDECIIEIEDLSNYGLFFSFWFASVLFFWAMRILWGFIYDSWVYWGAHAGEDVFDLIGDWFFLGSCLFDVHIEIKASNLIKITPDINWL